MANNILVRAIDAHQTASDLEDPRSGRALPERVSAEDARRALAIIQAYFDGTPSAAPLSSRELSNGKPQLRYPDAQISERQFKHICDLCSEQGKEPPEDLNQWNRKKASDLIEQLHRELNIPGRS